MELIYHPHPALSISRTFEVVKFSDPELQIHIDNMIKIMCDNDGVGLAANQVDKHHRMFVAEIGGDIQAFINPEITEFGKDIMISTEGCLSFPGMIAKLRCRSRHIQVKYYDRHGQLHEHKLSNLESAIYQHELDHLNGITILNRMSSLQRQIQLKKYRKESK